MQKAKLILLLFLFSFLSLASTVGVYFTHQLPTEEERSIPLGTYRHIGNYTYIAKLKPNRIYNKTTLEPGEGTIYLRITEALNITFNYTFETSQLSPANITIEYIINTYLETSKWSQQVSSSNINTISSINTATEQFSTNYYINTSSVNEIVKTINNEIGVFTSNYNYTISPQIHTVATTDAGTIDESFNPTMTIGFRYGTGNGDYIDIQGLEKTSPGVLTQTSEKVYLGWVILQRYASYASAFISFSALTITALVFLRTKPPIKKPKELPFEEIVAPFEEIMVEAAKEPLPGEQRTTITMKTLDDLVKVADDLGKPVIHSQRPSTAQSTEPAHIFYVFDGLVKYEYTMTAKNIIKKED